MKMKNEGKLEKEKGKVFCHFVANLEKTMTHSGIKRAMHCI